MKNVVNPEEEISSVYDQDRLCRYLLNHYEGVSKVEFIFFSDSHSGWLSRLLVNGSYEVHAFVWKYNGAISVSVPFSQGKGGSLPRKQIPSQDYSLSDIHIIY
ncbi:hypothetical protein DDV21_004920 [Streptococcus chenjunshii]|uniref:Uncharacterized protein n=1 Tax=Streptococcus chenjunshii TaxID=2173853 RepID=A0A372KPN1_9STRE|nr:hypothetical protein [Streptococcus chenjunshii]AXQ78464.1 hypothetical protein DDV21_004920 [Streptococcus chenjunshii]RFU52075.1 hypothetical protein DDV22_01125 [Streptococcus chenjunshii]RFU54267.1 hypothetical protein DDV23_01680 [Streptococcus chenjunshii]